MERDVYFFISIYSTLNTGIANQNKTDGEIKLKSTFFFSVLDFDMCIISELVKKN